jgi:hypothetical protein
MRPITAVFVVTGWLPGAAEMFMPWQSTCSDGSLRPSERPDTTSPRDQPTFSGIVDDRRITPIAGSGQWC